MELILYSPGTTTFNNMGLGVIQTTRAEATTGLNDIMELEFDAPITGRHYADIQKDCIVTAPHDDTKKRQPYKIYKSSAPIDGIVTFWARHISYDLNTVTVRPNTATSCAQAMGNMETYAINPRGFTFWTDVTTAGEFAVTVPTPCRKLLGGSKGSILDIYGGELEFDHWDVKLHARLGRDTDVNIVYGKNLVSIKNDIDNGSTYNAIVPFWYNEQDGLVTIDGYIVKRANMPATEPIRALPVDMSSDFQDKPTKAQLQTEAARRLASGKPWQPIQNVKVDFVSLWQTAEYADVAPLQRLTLGDTAVISVPNIGIDRERQKVVKTVYNVKLERYNKMELGQLKSTFGQVITAQTEEKLDLLPTKSFLQAAIEHATQMITGGLGGYVKFTLNADGEPEELLIMDTPSTQTAVNVWRFNKDGLGHSHSGYNGPFDDVALTADGMINASMIVTGLMSANRIHGGTLKLGGGSNGNGVLEVYDASGTRIGLIDNTGAHFTGDITMRKTTSANTFEALFKQITFYYQGRRYTQYGFEINKAKTSSSGASKFDFVPAGASGGIGDNAIISNWPLGIEVSEDNANYVLVKVFDNGLMVAVNQNGTVSNLIEAFNAGDDSYVSLGEINGTTTIHSEETRLPHIGTTSYSPNMYCGGSYGTVYKTSSSSKRYKKEISEKIPEDLDPARLYDLPVKTYKYRKGYLSETDTKYDKKILGFIAEDMDEIYPAACQYDAEGRPEMWNSMAMIPAMMKLIQDQKALIDAQDARIRALEVKANAGY